MNFNQFKEKCGHWVGGSLGGNDLICVYAKNHQWCREENCPIFKIHSEISILQTIEGFWLLMEKTDGSIHQIKLDLSKFEKDERKEIEQILFYHAKRE